MTTDGVEFADDTFERLSKWIRRLAGVDRCDFDAFEPDRDRIRSNVKDRLKRKGHTRHNAFDFPSIIRPAKLADFGFHDGFIFRQRREPLPIPLQPLEIAA